MHALEFLQSSLTELIKHNFLRVYLIFILHKKYFNVKYFFAIILNAEVHFYSEHVQIAVQYNTNNALQYISSINGGGGIINVYIF